MDRAGVAATGLVVSDAVIPEPKYTRLGDRHIAWQVIGDGPTDLVWNVGRIGSMEGEWADPEATAMLLRIASFCRMIRFDALGTGSSDPLPLDSLPPLEASVDELMAVMDAAGSERAVLFGGADSGPAAMLAAASRPERVLGLTLFSAAARL
jgi:pimeloyl-ACP methyl ester carboxylesterase